MKTIIHHAGSKFTSYNLFKRLQKWTSVLQILTCLTITVLELFLSMCKRCYCHSRVFLHSEVLAQFHRGKAKLLHWTLFYFVASWRITKLWYTWRIFILVQSEFNSDQLITLFDRMYPRVSLPLLACAKPVLEHILRWYKEKSKDSKSNEVLKISWCEIRSISPPKK